MSLYSLRTISLVLAVASCQQPNIDEDTEPSCPVENPECSLEDLDGDGILNVDDRFPNDSSCALRNEQNCSACGVGCDQDEKCSEEGSCVPFEKEGCDGVDNDLDGQVDENIEGAPLAAKQMGICAESRQRCVNGEWVDPNYLLIEGYETKESLCDGIDSDCDGEIDEELNAPLSSWQNGLCAGSLQICRGAESWSDPDKEDIDGFEESETICDGIDSDCDGNIDENLDPPLAVQQNGVCSGASKVCLGTLGWVEPDMSRVEGYETIDSSCDGVDSDCDGLIDESIVLRLSSNQAGICAGSTLICEGSSGWREPDLSELSGYESEETLCDGIDSDCDGRIDEGLNAPLSSSQFGVCTGSTMICRGLEGWSEPNSNQIAGFEPEETLCDGIDSDCDGNVDEELSAPLATRQLGVCVGSLKVCNGERGWEEPNFTTLPNYETIESLCDGVDSDCDGRVDEGLTAPLASNQNGLCSTSVKQCLGSDGWSDPDLTQIRGYEVDESACDGIDSDCDGFIDENLTMPLSLLQEGVCAGSVQRCVNGSWSEPSYTEITGYEQNNDSCDGTDNDCDGSVDEGVGTIQTTCGQGVCQRLGLGQCTNGVFTDSCTPGEASALEHCNGLDDDCDGHVDEGLNQLASRQYGVCAGATRMCDPERGGWIEPIYSEMTHFEEIERLCDGLDNDCDGKTDEESTRTAAPLSALQAGVCFGSNLSCVDGVYVEPIYEEVTINYEVFEVSCDGQDNDCDGVVDETLSAPEASQQRGVCANSLKVCMGTEGWVDPIYSSTINNYEQTETICDGLDSDCDGAIDEFLTPPLSENQAGVCSGSVKVCEGLLGWQEPNENGQIDNFESVEISCDGLDNDCDGQIDENLVPPPADLQLGVCEGLLKSSCDGSNGWIEPEYAQALITYNALDHTCDELDNDCDGVIDEGVLESCRDGEDNDCDGEVDEADCSAYCGDGFVDEAANEECDDSNLNDGDGCDLNCLVEECGNGRKESNEDCDDGNLVTELCDYGECVVCDETCTEISGTVTSYCGDGVVNGPEQCDGEVWCGNDCANGPPPCESSLGGCPELNFRRIEGGSFIMGDSSSDPSALEIPPHQVTVPSFEMMRTEVTVAMYRSCVEAGGCSEPVCRATEYCAYTKTNVDHSQHPVNFVSWYQMMEFASWVGARLPTEAEWEYAARNEGQNVIYPWGSRSPTCSYLNYNETCVNGTSRVCSYFRGHTDQGLCDMAGNVREWVQDEKHYNYFGAPTDGSGWCQRSCAVNSEDPNYNVNDERSRVVRGGSWHDTEFYARVYARQFHSLSFRIRSERIGGRLARSVH